MTTLYSSLSSIPVWILPIPFHLSGTYFFISQMIIKIIPHRNLGISRGNPALIKEREREMNRELTTIVCILFFYILGYKIPSFM